MFSWFKSRLAQFVGNASDGSPQGTDTHAHSAQSAAVVVSAAPQTPLQLYRSGQRESARLGASALLSGDAQSTEGSLVVGLLALDEGRNLEGLRHIETALALNRKSADAQLGLGRALAALGRKPEAIAALEIARSLDPDRGEPDMRLGLMALAGGRKEEAQRLLQSAVLSEPDLGEAHAYLGDLLLEMKQLHDAERHYRRAVAARPDLVAAWASLGALLKDAQRAGEAATHLERALEIQADLAPAILNLGLVRLQQQRWKDSAGLFRRYIEVNPKDSDGLYWLAKALMGMGESEAARKSYQGALRLHGGHLQARWGLTMSQLPAMPGTESEQAEALKSFERELIQLMGWYKKNPDAAGFLTVGAQQPYYLAYIARNHKAVLGLYGILCTALMGVWARRVKLPAPPAKTSGVAGAQPAASRRIGIVSSHVHSHSVWHALLRGWIENLPSLQFELHIFYTAGTRDAETDWASRKATTFNQGHKDWREWAKIISDTRCEVLIYPEIGMDSTALRLASLRLARVQLGSWGHPLSSGLPTLDGFISAKGMEPDDAASHYTERLVTLPNLGCFCKPYQTQPVQVSLSAHGIATGDRILLCAGTPFKYAPADDVLWVDIARRCRPCKLVFFRQSEGNMADLLEARLRKAFESAGVSFDESVRFIPWQSQAAFFGLLDRADAYLDSVGFSGFNTTMQAVERGTPIVAWEGEFLRGRFASGILRQMDMPEWVASTHEAYAQKVERLCSDIALRQTVRRQIGAVRTSLYGDLSAVTALAEHLKRL